MKNPATTRILRLGNLALKSHELEKQCRALREQIREITGKGFYTSSSITEGQPPPAMNISILLPLYLQVAPAGTKPRLHIFEKTEHREVAYAQLHYPVIEIGLVNHGKTLLTVDSWSESFDPPATPPPDAVTTLETAVP